MKQKAPSSTVDRLILEEASEWFVDFRVGDIDQTSRVRFDEWLRRSPEHIRAYMEIARTYVELPSAKLTDTLDVASMIAYAHSQENILPFLKGRGPTGNNTDLVGNQARGSSRTQRYLAAAACALLIIAGGAVWWDQHRFPYFVTDIGERRSVTLNDGSTVDLNAHSRLRIEFTKNERRVYLLDGQALFQVAKDKNRPFIVSSGTATVRAVGTQFDVYHRENGTTVTVLEGRVAVYSAVGRASPPAVNLSVPTPRDPSPAPKASHPATGAVSLAAPLLSPPGLSDPSGSGAVFLSAGEQVIVTPAEGVHVPAPADIVATTAWVQRRLIFDGSRLADVAQEFNRYNRRQLIIDGAQLSDFHVSGVYSSSDPASLIRFLRDQPGVKITEDANEVLISGQ